MIYITLHKIGDAGVMAPNGGREEVVRMAVPIQVIGPMEECAEGTILYLASGFGQIKVSEKMDDVIAQITNIARALSGVGR